MRNKRGFRTVPVPIFRTRLLQFPDRLVVALVTAQPHLTGSYGLPNEGSIFVEETIIDPHGEFHDPLTNPSFRYLIYSRSDDAFMSLPSYFQFLYCWIHIRTALIALDIFWFSN